MRMLAATVASLVCCTLFAQAPNSPGGFASRDPRYKLQANDAIDVQFRYTPEFNTPATIQPDGYISTQITGDVKIAGLTLAEATAAIKEKAGVRLKDPEVTIFLKDFVKPHFVVAGEVNHPGTFELHGDVGIVQAIATSGGFKDSAHRKQVVLVRKVNSEVAEVKVFDVNRLMSAKGVREDPQLQPDDMLMVPRNAIQKLEPLIRLSSLGLYGLALGLP